METEQYQKEGWHNNPETLLKIMDEYVNDHDGSDGISLVMIDDLLHSATQDQNRLWTEVIHDFNKKEHSQDGRNLLMQKFIIIKR